MARLVATLPPARRVRQAAAAAYPTQTGAKTTKAPPVARSNPDLWRWYLTPEVWAVADRVARNIRRVAFYPAVNVEGAPADRCPPLVNPDGTTAEGVDATLARDAAAVWATVRSPMGGQSDLFGMLALCLMVSGDGLQFGYPAGPDLTFDPDGAPIWVAFARPALTERAGMYEVDVGADAKVKVPPQADGSPGGRLVRVWRADPRGLAQADVWTNHARDPLAHLTMIYEAVAACALSRLNAGVILAPDDQDRKGPPGGMEVEEAAATLGEPLYRRLVDLFADHVELSQLEQDGFSRAVPVALGLNSALIEKVRWLELAHNLDPELGERIDDLRQRILMAAPLPNEVIAGMSELSGLGGGNVAAQISQDEYQTSIVPTCDTICDANTDHVLRAALLLMNHEPRQVAGLRVGYSADELLMKPDRSTQAIQLAQLPVSPLTADELRDATGLAEYEGPDEPTQQRMLAERLLVAKGAEFAHLLEFLGLPGVPGVEEPPPEADPIEPVDEPADAAARQAAAVPDLRGARLVEVGTRYEDVLTVLFGAVIDRMVERAGARVASLSTRADWAEVRDLVRSAPPDLRGAVPGVNARLAAADVDDDDLLGGALATFADRFASTTTTAQRRSVRVAGGDWDGLEADADHHATVAWALAGRLLIGEARRRFDGRLPDDQEGEGAGLASFAAPALLVRRVSAVAGGSPDVGEGGAGARPTTSALMSIATGPLAQRALAQAGAAVTAWMWDYRPEEDRATYEDHLDLHEQIELGAEPGEFDGYFPGDHHGCRCVLRPITVSGALGEGVEFG